MIAFNFLSQMGHRKNLSMSSGKQKTSSIFFLLPTGLEKQHWSSTSLGISSSDHKTSSLISRYSKIGHSRKEHAISPIQSLLKRLVHFIQRSKSGGPKVSMRQLKPATVITANTKPMDGWSM